MIQDKAVFGGQGHILPSNWEQAYDYCSKRYFYVDHTNKTTTWINPLDKFNKPKTSNECNDDQLPYGWERISDAKLGEYYTNHLEYRNQWTNPVDDWRKISQPYYSNNFILEQSRDSLDSNNQTASQATTDTKPADTSLHASDVDEKFTTSLNNSNTLSTEIIDTMRSSSSTRGSRYDTGLVDIMDNRFGRKSSQSVEV